MTLANVSKLTQTCLYLKISKNKNQALTKSRYLQKGQFYL